MDPDQNQQVEKTLLVIPILAEELFILNFPIHRTHVAEEQMIHDQTPLHV